MSALTNPASWVLLDWIMLLLGGWLVVGVVGVFALRNFALVAQVLFPLGGALGVVLFGVALAAMLGAFFILDDPIFNGLAVSLIFGIFVSTALTLVVIPVLYYAVYRRHHDLSQGVSS